MMSQRVTAQTIQRLLLKRFALATGTYVLGLMLVWMAYFTGYYNATFFGIWCTSVLVLFCQAALSLVFFGGYNRRF